MTKEEQIGVMAAHARAVGDEIRGKEGKLPAVCLIVLGGDDDAPTIVTNIPAGLVSGFLMSTAMKEGHAFKVPHE